ncbi:hypothetical protein [Kyrpidia sp.]|uniref:hypothetical protein n=1 Tax=Kyrpidia sp. TaxID=2073077 RepID=UPI002584636E|nr:hypothetical protein [Kyrpidia sp.]MCL6577486.1 hypothetical protein [Kyrpidia sp.]
MTYQDYVIELDDTVVHLGRVSFGGGAWRWMIQFLDDEKVRVVVHDERDVSGRSRRGIPRFTFDKTYSASNGQRIADDLREIRLDWLAEAVEQVFVNE